MQVQAGAARPRRQEYLTFAACLLASGFSGLVLEVVWARQIKGLVGSSSMAQIVVLASFMSGLALGSWWLGRLADRSARPARLYALLELAIAGYALLFPLIVKAASLPFLAVARGYYPEHLGAVSVLRLGLAVLLLLPPTVLMGGTLPAAVRFLTATESGLRPVLGRLYFLNSLGAAAGAALATFLLVPRLGLWGASALAASLNVLAAILSYALSRRSGARIAEDAPIGVTERTLTTLQVRLAIFAAASAGLASLALEVAYLRLLALILGSSVHAFAVMLSAFILGIALGGLFASSTRLKIRDPMAWMAALLAGAVVALVVEIPLYERLMYWLTRLRVSLPTTDAGFAAYQALTFLVCLGLMLVPTICMGAALPLAARAAARNAHSLGRAVGITWAANTFGTVAGAVGACLLLPHLGLRGVYLASVAVLVLAAALATLAAEGSLRLRKALPASLAAGALLLAFALPGWNYSVLTSGIFRKHSVPDADKDSFEIFREQVSRDLFVRYARDGSHTTVAVTEHRPSGVLVLSVNGKPDASSDSDMPTQSLLGHLPMILKPEAKSALIVGLGSGVTAGDLLRHEGVVADVVELSPEVIEAARQFDPFNDGVLDNPRMRLFVDDGKAFLKLTPRKYDVIISEPANIWLTGVSGLFSKEFYKDVDAALAPGGLFVQWFQTYEISDELLAMVTRTLTGQFPWVYTFVGSDGDLLFVGSRQELAPSVQTMRAAFTPEVVQSLARARLPPFLEGILGLQVLSPQAALAFPGDGPINTDARPTLEFLGSKAFFMGRSASVLEAIDERRWTDGEGLLAAKLGLDVAEPIAQLAFDPQLTELARQRSAEFLAGAQHGDARPEQVREALKLLLSASEEQPFDERRLWAQESLAYTERLIAAPRAKAEDFALHARMLRRVGRHEEAAASLRAALTRAGPEHPIARWLTRLSCINAEAGNLERAQKRLQEAKLAGATFSELATARATLARAEALKRQGS